MLVASRPKWECSSVRVVVRVRPNSKRTHVGGRYGDGEPAVLVVRVQAPAVDGKANEAVVAAIADALGVPKNAVRIVNGLTSRIKTIEVDGLEESSVQNLLDG